ncbi:cell division protein FtsZ [Orientia chuto str. Dubai]|uniref:Cell division protein FtsZ n=1 Tax=Orientia chuto str. Dubai TaxID=1359168 RepID=A0A0F3MKU8_9RICK|nr:cell division protein FtsZ [Candidatus Orientia mediorientalis]KJV56271.1 cell division protein FtsZ [Orientia chuto str. Dubai]
MSTDSKTPENLRDAPVITVFGVGGGGSNAIDNMITSNLQGVNFIVANTDAQALSMSLAKDKIQLGESTMGAGADPSVGAAAAEKSYDEIKNKIENSNMIFIAAGMGGGTGTGAAPVVARIAKELGILTVAVVTKPFTLEGGQRMKIAEAGIEELQKYVDTVIIIPNQYLFRVSNQVTTFVEAFKMADTVLTDAVTNMTNLINLPGLINLDFADVVTIIKKGGKSMMGTGEASGEDRAIKAAETAISNPLLDNSSIKKAKGVLIHITGGNDMTLMEVDEAVNHIRKEIDDDDSSIIFGATFNPDLQGKIKISVVASSISNQLPEDKKSVNDTNEDANEDTNADAYSVNFEHAKASELNSNVVDHSLANATNAANDTINHQLHKDNSLSSLYSSSTMQLEGAPTKTRMSIFARMWRSIKSDYSTIKDKESENQEFIKVEAEENIYEIPTFLRKNKK